MNEKEITVDGIKTKIVVDLDDDYYETLTEEESELDKTIELDTVIKDIEKTMEINLNDKGRKNR